MNVEPFAQRGGVVFAALMPHAPILIPDVGQEELKLVVASVAGMKLAAARLSRRQPEAVVIISPHSPRSPDAFGMWSDKRLWGTFGQFGAPGAAIDLPNDLPLITAFKDQARRVGVRTWEIPDQPLDHGALVPLWYLTDAGWDGPTSVLSLNYPHEGGLIELGRALMGAATRLGKNIAIIASGDMSHRLTRHAPAGYEPRAHDFDREFIACLRLGTYRDLQQMDPKLQALAGEDALDSTIVALASVNWAATGHEVLSYEGPFGVGYGVAILFDSDVAAATSREERSLGQRWHPMSAETLPQAGRRSLGQEELC